MKPLIYSIGQVCLSIVLLMTLLIFSDCKAPEELLDAKFESDVLGNPPNKTLPGNPTGDEILYANEVAGQLEIVAGSGGSGKALLYKGTQPSGNLGDHFKWISFKGKSGNFNKSVSFRWTARRNFPSSGASLYIDVSDGGGTLAARLKLEQNGQLFLITNLLSDQCSYVGTIPNNEVHTMTVTVDVPANKLIITALIPNGNNIPGNTYTLLESDIDEYDLPARPTISFKFSNYISTYNYKVEEVFITRKK